MQKFGKEDFDVPMGCFDGAEVCELVVLLILTKLCDVLQRENVGLHQADGLAIVKQMPGPELKWKEKRLLKYLKSMD